MGLHELNHARTAREREREIHGEFFRVHNFLFEMETQNYTVYIV